VTLIYLACAIVVLTLVLVLLQYLNYRGTMAYGVLYASALLLSAGFVARTAPEGLPLIETAGGLNARVLIGLSCGLAIGTAISALWRSTSSHPPMSRLERGLSVALIVSSGSGLLALI
jgi:hypothetical protein